MANEVRITVTADTNQAEKSIGGLGNTLSSVGTIASGFLAANVVQGAISGITNFANESIKAASSLGESLNAVNVVFGESADKVLKWGETSATQFGLSQRAFNEMATPLGAMLKNAGFGMEQVSFDTIALTERAADMASVFNTDVKDALGAITAGLRGEADPLERFGVKLSAAAVEAKALAETGKTTAKSLTDQELAAARVALIFEQTEAVAGDFKNTSDGLANSQRVAAAEMETLQAQVGEKMLPAMLALTKAKMAVAKVVVDYLLPVLDAIGRFFSDTVIPAFNDFKEQAAPVLKFVSQIAGEQFAKFKAYYEESLKPALENIGALIEWVIGKFQEYWPQISAITQPILEQLIAMITTAFEVVTGILDVFIKLIAGDFSGAWEALKNVVKATFDYMVDTIGRAIKVIEGLGGLLVEVGKNMILGFLSGIQSMWGRVTSWLWEQINKLPSIVKQALGIASPSRVFAAIGEQTMAGMELGLRKGAASVSEFLKDTSLDMGVNVSGNMQAGVAGAPVAGGGIVINISGIVTDPASTGRAIADAINAASNQSGPIIRAGAIA